jgi:hypothetical protein
MSGWLRCILKAIILLLIVTIGPGLMSSLLLPWLQLAFLIAPPILIIGALTAPGRSRKTFQKITDRLSKFWKFF